MGRLLALLPLCACALSVGGVAGAYVLAADEHRDLSPFFISAALDRPYAQNLGSFVLSVALLAAAATVVAKHAYVRALLLPRAAAATTGTDWLAARTAIVANTAALHTGLATVIFALGVCAWQWHTQHVVHLFFAIAFFSAMTAYLLLYALMVDRVVAARAMALLRMSLGVLMALLYLAELAMLGLHALLKTGDPPASLPALGNTEAAVEIAMTVCFSVFFASFAWEFWDCRMRIIVLEPPPAAAVNAEASPLLQPDRPALRTYS